MFGGEKKADCPFWRGPCKEHECRLYVQLVGKHPQTGADISQWGCSFQFLPFLMIENAKEQRQTAASVDSFRNEMVAANGIIAIQQQIAGAIKDAPMIEPATKRLP